MPLELRYNPEHALTFNMTLNINLSLTPVNVMPEIPSGVYLEIVKFDRKWIFFC